MKVGDKIYFKGEKIGYTVMACDERYAICVKPFNIKHTVQYCIVDFIECIRGADNYWKWGGYYDYSDKEECEKCLKGLYSGEVKISSRNQVLLEITKIKQC